MASHETPLYRDLRRSLLTLLEMLRREAELREQAGLWQDEGGEA
mgnify:FL=1